MTVTEGNKTAKTEQAAEVAPREELVTATIDDVEVSVPKGTLVIRAAEMIGVAVPRFCDHPLLDPVGACRQCLVEVTDDGRGRGMPKPQASCTIEVMPGMKISTQVTSPVAEKAQAGMLELLLMNHPLDCPICDKGGECPLQNQSMSNGAGESRYEGVKRTFPKPINISSQVLLDRERCVLCARCTRFSEQIAGDPFIALVERGALQQVGIYESEPFESYFSGNTIQICPVGALTSAAYRFRSRPFDLVSSPSIAEHDACGSAIRVDHRRGTVMRRLAGDDPEVNEEWITDRDRFAFRSARGEDRITRPLVRDGDDLRPASWPEAIDVAAKGLAAAGADVGVLTGGRLTRENAYGYAKFARTVLGTNNIDFRSRPSSAEEAEFLAHTVAGTELSVSYADLETASSVLMVGFEPEEEAGSVFLRLRKAFRKRQLRSWTLAPYLSNGARKMGATLIPTVPVAEADTLANLPAEVALDADSVILVGERAANSAGTFTELRRLATETGAKLAWIPRRAGDRGALDAGCLPQLLPGGRPLTDAAARIDSQAIWGVDSLNGTVGLAAGPMLDAAARGELALVVAGVEPGDFRDPEAARRGLEQASFVVSLETRMSEVTERADVVFPVALTEQQGGSFVNWEGRIRSFDAVLPDRTTMTDLRVLAALADALGRDLGVRTTSAARAELDEFGSWDGARAAEPQPGPIDGDTGEVGQAVLATWRTMIDASRSNDGEPALMGTARRPVARVGARTAAEVGLDGTTNTQLTLATDRGRLTFDAEVVEGMVDGVVWVPTNAPGLSVTENLVAVSGELVRLSATATTQSEGGEA
ncbi:NADH-quinone oxidoreductase subunit G [Propionibacteriaceae bacterium Y1700]|uniref:NADH-quinone oxidoreductase subunit G n=1 Tax=Microlunatus sp. Y1700 TaxID=3418487 RepID=UPI003DA780C0